MPVQEQQSTSDEEHELVDEPAVIDIPVGLEEMKDAGQAQHHGCHECAQARRLVLMRKTKNGNRK